MVSHGDTDFSKLVNLCPAKHFPLISTADGAAFFTNAEYETLSGIKMDVQSYIETLELFIVRRSRSSKEHLGYVETGTECLKDILMLGIFLKLT